MFDPEVYREFLRQERCEPSRPVCYHCGAECSGDTTESVTIDGQTGEVPVCDEGSGCFPEPAPLCRFCRGDERAYCCECV